MKINFVLMLFMFLLVQISYAQTCTSDAQCISPMSCINGQCGELRLIQPPPVYIPPAPATSPNWITTAFIAIVTSLIFLGLIYAVGIGFNVNELKFLANEELYQLIVTALMIGLLAGAQAYLNGPFSSAFEFINQAGQPIGLQEYSLNMLNNLLNIQRSIFNDLRQFSISVGRESSRSIYCSIQGTGFSASPCGSFSALTTPASLSLSAISFSITELSSLYTLANFGQRYAFSILLPIGILLRTLKITRGAGGLFIGLAAALFLFLPLALVSMDAITTQARPYSIRDTATGTAMYVSDQRIGLLDPVCNVNAFAGSSGVISIGGGIDYENSNNAQNIFNQLEGNLRYYLYAFLIEGTLTTIVCLLVVFTSIRWISKLAGAEIDLSPIMRIA